LGGVHVLGTVIHLVRRLGGGLLQILGEVLRLRRELALLLGQVLGVGLRRLGLVLGLVGDVAFLLGQLVEALGGVLQLGDVVAALLDLGHLVLELLLGVLQRLDRVVLLGDCIRGLLLLHLSAGVSSVSCALSRDAV